MAFREKIAEKAAALAESKQPRETAPEAVPAQPDPPAEVVTLEPAALALPPVKKTWFSIVASRPVVPVRVVEIQEAVCAAYGVELNDMTSARRTARVVMPRQVAMYLAKELTGRSLPEIGRRFGDRDHTTVLHAVRKIAAKVNADAPETFDPELSDLVKGLRAKIEASRGE